MHLHGLFNRAEHCLTVSIIPPLTFHFFSFLCYLLSGGLGWPHRGRGGNGLGLTSPIDAALLVPTNNKDDFVIYICVWLSHSLCLGLESNGQQNSGLVNFAREFHKSVPVTQQAAQALADWIKKWNLNSLLI